MCSVAKNPLGAIRMVEERLKRRNKVIIISIRADIKALQMCLLANTIVKMFAFFQLQFNETLCMSLIIIFLAIHQINH